MRKLKTLTIRTSMVEGGSVETALKIIENSMAQGVPDFATLTIEEFDGFTYRFEWAI